MYPLASILNESEKKILEGDLNSFRLCFPRYRTSIAQREDYLTNSEIYSDVHFGCLHSFDRAGDEKSGKAKVLNF